MSASAKPGRWGVSEGAGTGWKVGGVDEGVRMFKEVEGEIVRLCFP